MPAQLFWMSQKPHPIINKVSVRVISLSLWLQLITPTSTFIIPSLRPWLLLDDVFVISTIIKVGVISQSRKITLIETLIILKIRITLSKKPNNCFIIYWTKSHVFASVLTTSNTKCMNLTWLRLEITCHGHTWHDNPWTWVSFTFLICSYIMSQELILKIHAFGQSERSSMYNIK